MAYASNFTSGVSTPLDYSARARRQQRERTLNAGYMLFAFGALWVLAIVAWMMGTSVSLLECMYTATGDAAICGSSALVQGPVSDTHAGLDVSKITIPAGLSGSGYDAF